MTGLGPVEGVDLQGPGGIRARISSKYMAELIAISMVGLTTALGYAFWEHKEDSKRFQHDMNIALKEMAAASLQQGLANQELACIVSHKIDDRTPVNYEKCRWIVRTYGNSPSNPPPSTSERR